MHTQKYNSLAKIQCNFVCIVFFLFIGGQAISQENLLSKEIILKLENSTLRQGFKQIEKQLGCHFTYETTTFNDQKKLTLNIQSISLKNGLDKMLNDSSLIYKVIDNHVIIRNRSIKKNNNTRIDTIPKYREIRGTILDAEEGTPLSFSSISVWGYSVGAVANEQGEFIFKVPEKYYGKQICISHIGYKNQLFLLDEIPETAQTYTMEKSIISLQEVVIRKRDAKALLLAALESRATNYSTEPLNMTGFYREMVKRRNDYMFFSEAVVKVYKPSYTREAELDKIKVLKARKMIGLSIEDTVIVKLKSGLFSCMELDLVKNPPDFMKPESMNDYDYNVVDIVDFNNRNTYLIEFKQKENILDALFMGKMYIDIESLAIVGAEFSMNPDKMRQAQSKYIAQKKRGVKPTMTSIDYQVNYRMIDDTYYLNYVRGKLKMKVRKRKKIFPTNFETSFELAITDIDTLHVEKFKRKETYNMHSIFINDIYEYDETFWGNYNLIQPDIPLQQAIKKIDN